MTDPTPTDDPRTALEQAAIRALDNRPTAPTRTHFVRLCLPQIERCQALGWSGADFATVLGAYMPMTARQFGQALRFARASAGRWGRQHAGRGAPSPKTARKDEETTNPGPGKWEIPELKGKRLKHNPSSDDDVFD